MDRADAVALTDHALQSLQPGPADDYALRAMLTDAFKMLSAPEHVLVVGKPLRDLKVYLLDNSGLTTTSVRLDPVAVSTEFLAADKIVISMSCHETASTQKSVSWSTIWHVDISQSLNFIGRVGPDLIDETEQFARELARVAGWPLEPAEPVAP